MIETWSGPILPDLSAVPQDAFGVQAAHVQDSARMTAHAAGSTRVQQRWAELADAPMSGTMKQVTDRER